MITVATTSIGEAWLEIARDLLDAGRTSRYDGLPIRELAAVTIEVAHPDPADETIARLADPERLDWMRRNFVEPDLVAELGDARSYASRLHDYAGTQGYRHRSRTNVTFCDAHAESIKDRYTDNADGATTVAPNTGFLSPDDRAYDPR